MQDGFSALMADAIPLLSPPPPSLETASSFVCGADEYRERANNMTIPAEGWLVLHRLSSKRPPQYSVKRNGGRLSVQTRALSAALSYGFEIGQEPGRIPASETANRNPG